MVLDSILPVNWLANKASSGIGCSISIIPAPTTLLLMISLPLSFAGISIALRVTGKSLNLSSFLGILLLFGIVVNNAIMLFENYRRRIGGHSIEHGVRHSTRPGLGDGMEHNVGSSVSGYFKSMISISVYRGSSERLRPILLTTLTTLLPVANNPEYLIILNYANNINDPGMEIILLC